jgi:hypothetical protein
MGLGIAKWSLAMALDKYRTVKAARPITAQGYFGPPELIWRKKFINAVDKQIQLLNGQYQPKEGERVRRWFWQSGQHYFTDIRYGNKSLFPEGEAYRCADQEALKEFYGTLKADAANGDLDKAFQEVAEAMKKSTGAALIKARMARGGKKK